MTAYISISYSKRKLMDEELNAIVDTLKSFSIVPFVFVDQYQFNRSEEQQMMQQAMTDIDRCDILIAETSDKGIGIGIEVGYAKALNKPVIYIRRKEAEHSTTVSGISDFQIIYADTSDLQVKLETVIHTLMVQ
jgi:2'-deoxynucleoside 5'-phosphate N-hydrolase